METPARGIDLAHEAGDPPFVHRIGTSRTIYSAGSFARVTTGRHLRRDLRALFRRERIDVVHVHGGLNPTLGLVAPDAAGDLGLPVVATFHSWFARSALCRVFRRPLQRRLDRHAAVMAVSQPVVEAHARYFEADWEIIPNGVDTEFFRADASTGPPSGDPELLFLGRLDPRNGLDTVLAAMPEVLERRAGRPADGGGRRAAAAGVRAAGPAAGRRVEFVGRVNGNRPEHYARADMYLCPTTKASFGITLLEAMACGTPMVVSDITGFRELVGDGAEAVLVPKDDPAAWADAMVGLMADRAPARAHGRGRPHARPRRTRGRVIAARVMDVYRRVAVMLTGAARGGRRRRGPAGARRAGARTARSSGRSSAAGRATGALYLTFDDGPNPYATERIVRTARARAGAGHVLHGRPARGPVSRAGAAGGARGLRASATTRYSHVKLRLAGPGATAGEVGARARGHRAAHGSARPPAFARRTGTATRAFAARRGLRLSRRRLDARRVGHRASRGRRDPPARASRRCGPVPMLLLHDGDGYDPEGDRTPDRRGAARHHRGLPSDGI